MFIDWYENHLSSKGFMLGFNKFMPNVNITNHYRKFETKDSEEGKIKILRGIYEHDESNTGGPFVVYMFDNEAIAFCSVI